MSGNEVSETDFSDGHGPLISNSSPSNPTGSGSWNMARQFRTFRYLMDENGRLIVFPVMFTDELGTAPPNFQTGGGDALNNTDTTLPVSGFGYEFNGATWDRIRNNSNIFNLTDNSTSTFQSGNQTIYNSKVQIVEFLVSAFVGTSWQPEIDYQDGAGNTQILWQKPTAMTAAATVVLFCGVPAFSAIGANTGYLGFTQTDAATGNQAFVLPVPLPRLIKFKYTKTAATTFTSRTVADSLGN